MSADLEPSTFQVWAEVVIPALVGGATLMLAVASVWVSVLSWRTSKRATAQAERGNDLAAGQYRDMVARDRRARLVPLVSDLRSWHFHYVRLYQDRALPPPDSPSPMSLFEHGQKLLEPSIHLITTDLLSAMAPLRDAAEPAPRKAWNKHNAQAREAIETWAHDPDAYETSGARKMLLHGPEDGDGGNPSAN